LGDIRRRIEAGESSAVIPNLLMIITQYPGSKSAVEAHYWLGVAYESIRSYQDAMAEFNEYIRLAPKGPYAEEAWKSAARLREAYKREFGSPEQLAADIATVSEQLRQSPGDHELQFKLADLLWRRGDYENAGALYARIAREHPEHAEDAVLKQRIEIMPTGGYIVLTPSEIERRAIEEQPLAILNTASFQTGRDLITRQYEYYVVTGQAVNRSDSTLYGVQVDVTVYGFGSMVYDTTTVNIGRLNPGERRAFSVRFGNLANIDDVHRFECVGRFER
jgi:tetratricopeptide (TPR) repeat protein